MTQIIGEFDRLPPHDTEAEKCAIASLLLCVDGGSFGAIAAIANRDDYYSTDHQIYYEVMCAMNRAGKPIDVTLVRAELMRREVWEEVGGAAYMGDLMNTVPSTAHGIHYASIVKEKSLLRRCITAANDVLRAAYHPSKDDRGIEIAAAGVKALSTIAANGQNNRAYKLSEAIEEVVSKIEAGDVPRIKTGIRELDACTGGLPIGKFTLIGARPAMGKSLVIKQVLRNMAAMGIPVGLITIEESRLKVAENCLSALSGIENNKIAYHTLCKEEWDEIGPAMVAADKLPFYIADFPVRLMEVDTAIASLVAEHGCKVIAIDYIQLIDGNDPNENREITLVSRTIKAAFKRFGVAGLVAAQLNRGNEQGETRWPVLKDLRGSGSLEQDGDLIILLHSEDYYRQQKGDPIRDGKLMMLVRKNKDGATADVPVYLSKRTQEIRDWNEPHPSFGNEAA